MYLQFSVHYRLCHPCEPSGDALFTSDLLSVLLSAQVVGKAPSGTDHGAVAQQGGARHMCMRVNNLRSNQSSSGSLKGSGPGCQGASSHGGKPHLQRRLKDPVKLCCIHGKTGQCWQIDCTEDHVLMYWELGKPGYEEDLCHLVLSQSQDIHENEQESLGI